MIKVLRSDKITSHPVSRPRLLTRYSLRPFNSARKKFHFFRETWGGIEPPHRAFAELRLTTWPPGLGLDFSFDLKARQFAGGFFRRGRFQNRCGGYGGYEICRG
ncbi:MAG: hypothetical protein RL292_371 [Candidatus Parcubacteria bacterium]